MVCVKPSATAPASLSSTCLVRPPGDVHMRPSGFKVEVGAWIAKTVSVLANGSFDDGDGVTTGDVGTGSLGGAGCADWPAAGDGGGADCAVDEAGSAPEQAATARAARTRGI